MVSVRPAALAFGWCAAGVLAMLACSDDDDMPSAGDSGPAGSCGERACDGSTPVCDADAASCAGEVLTPCVTSLDCGTDQVCDDAAGWCVQCVISADCDDAEVCVGRRCRVSCASDKDCTPTGELCDRTAGHCVDCLDDRGCAETSHCDLGACTADVCRPGESSCRGEVVVRCNESGGAMVDESTCPTGEVCIDDEDGVRCGQPTCSGADCGEGPRCTRAAELCMDDPAVEVDCETFAAAPPSVLTCVDAAASCDGVIGCLLDVPPTGECAGDGGCEVFESCAALLAASPGSPDGVYTIDVDGDGGPEEPFDVYCDMTTRGGGWQLISVSRAGDEDPILVGPGYCTDISPDVHCKGQMHPAQVTSDTEILVRDLVEGNWIAYTGFSADEDSTLRFFSLELTLSISDACIVGSGCGCDNSPCSCSGHDNTCNDTRSDPDLAILETSGYTYEYNPPLYQWWRYGGWYVGAQPQAAYLNQGSVHATQYKTYHQLSTRSVATATSVSPVSTGHQAILHRSGTLP